MADPIITRDPIRLTEVWTQGKVTGITVTLTLRHEDNEITYTDTYHLAEEDQVWAEDWQHSKSTLGPGLAGQALEALNVEYKLYSQLRDYLDALPTG
jgi:hypothetical protein